MKTKARRSRRGGKSAPRRSNVLPASAIVYRGPVIKSSDRRQDDVIERVLCVSGIIQSSATGIIAAVFNNNPSNSTDFANYVGTYESARVVAESVKVVPIFDHFANTFGLTLNQTAVAYALSRDPTAIPGGLNNVLSHPSGVLTNTMSRFTIRGNMDGSDEAQWFPTASPTGTRSFQVYASGLTATSNYFFYVQKLRVQFRSAH